MIAEFLFSQKVNTCESRDSLDKNKTAPAEGGLLSDAKVLEFCGIAEHVLETAEKRFPDFAADTGTTVNVYFVDNEMIRDINREERGIDAATDVLSFPFLDLKEGDGEIDTYDLNPENGAIMLGEIVVSMEKMAEQAKEYGHGESRELAFLVCHAFLHLMGYDHEEKADEEKMFSLTEDILTEAGYTKD